MNDNQHYMITHGACGTTMFISLLKELGSSGPTGGHYWNQHSRICRETNRGKVQSLIGLVKNLDIPDHANLVYLYSNPMNALISLTNRGFLNVPNAHCLNMDGDIEGLGSRNSWTLEEYLDNGIDYFKFQDHFATWFEYSQRRYNIMFVRYESLDRLLPEVMEWWGFDRSNAMRLSIHARKSDWTQQPEKIRKGLVNMFNHHNDYLLGLDDKIVLETTI